MDQQTIRTLAVEAIRGLRAYQKTGLAGFWQKAIDRIRELGINVGGWQASKENAEHLANHLALCGYTTR
jgi:hypothetical protein